MKKLKLFVALVTTAAAAFFAGCASDTAHQAANTVENTASKETPVLPAATEETTSTGSLATPTEAYRTAYELRKRKDVEGLKRVFSKDVLEFLALFGEEDGRTVEDALKEMTERPQADTAEVRNEKISGDTATLEYLDEKGEWKTMDFIKEGGEWKLTIPKGEPDDDASK